MGGWPPKGVMGRRGTKKQPAAAKRLLGTYREDRDGGRVELPPGVPDIPPWLTVEERRYWPEIAQFLLSRGLLTQLDGISLGLLCEVLTDMISARAVVEKASRNKKNGGRFCCRTAIGNVIQHPAVGVMNKAHDRLVKLLVQFGMTPAARSSMKAPEQSEAGDPLKEFGVVA